MTIPHPFHRVAFHRVACHRVALAALLFGTALPALAQITPPPAGTIAPPPPGPIVESEKAYTRKLDAVQPHWAFIRGGFGDGATRIYSGDTGKMVGTIDTSRWSDMALDPTNHYYYVSETIWTKVIRGTRQDMVSIYDPTELKLLAEVPMPGRLLIGARKNNFIISDDGKTGFIYNLSPASSVNVVDLAKRKFSQTIELPGCASLMPVAGVGFSALCGDGTLATVAVGAKDAKITHTAPFFSATGDPIFDNFTYDRAKGTVTFLSYTGLITEAKLGATPTVGQSWSIQAAAGLRPGDTKPLDVNWLPGGRQIVALHRPTGRLYVLMHIGEFWSHKEPGTEIWEVDPVARKVVRRVPLKHSADNIEITQDAKPLIFLTGGGEGGEDRGKARILDATTYEQKFEIENAGGGVIATIEPR